MSEWKTRPEEVDQFILEQIDSVPHLEALLLIWRNRPKAWPLEIMAKALYVPVELAGDILRDLTLRGLIEPTSESQREYQYVSSPSEDSLMELLETTYRRELIRVTRMIHAKAPSAVREFARAFRFTKEKEKDKPKE
ncbi:MAG TPA: hypothetical protein VFA90_14735 [Terriglobales bacterium]|nr:hypothetical protein [Terriglobales bacterium]